MLQILINDKPLELPEGCKVRLKLSNPIFVKDIGSYSFPITIRQSPYNLAVLGMAKQAPRQALIKEFNAVLRFKRREIQCLATINSMSDGDISLYIKTDKALINTRLKDKYLTDLQLTSVGNLGILYGGGNSMTGIDSLPKYTATHDAPFAFFPVYNTGLTTASYTGNLSPSENEHIQNNWAQNYPTSSVTNQGLVQGEFLSGCNHLTPFFYVHFIVEKILSSLGISITENCLKTNPNLKKLCIYSNVIWTADYCAELSNKEIPASLFLPRIKMLDFLKAIQETFNVNIVIDYMNYKAKIISYNEIVRSNNIVSKNAIGDIKFNTSNYYDSYSFKFANDDGLPSTFRGGNNESDSEKTLEISSLLNAAPDEYTFNHYFQQWDYEDEHYESRWVYVKTPNITCDCVLDVDVMKGTVPSDTPVTPLIFMYSLGMYTSPGHTGELSVLNGIQFPCGRISTNFEFKFQWPINTGDFRVTYNGGYPYHEKLDWSSDFGIYYHYYKQYLFWKTQRAQSITWNEQLTEDELLGFDWAQKRMINEQQCFVYEIDVEITANHINVAQMSGETL